MDGGVLIESLGEVAAAVSEMVMKWTVLPKNLLDTKPHRGWGLASGRHRDSYSGLGYISFGYSYLGQEVAFV